LVKEVISIPVHPSLTPEELEQVVSVVNDAVTQI
jgi:dTDP-4-amino-4,6-dideoxygalactose transaminase